MKLAHLRAILWMRWRVLLNRMRSRGKGSHVLLGIILVVGPLIAIGLFALALGVGREALPDASPKAVMMSWLGLTMAFLFFWVSGLVTELQQSDSMSIKALLHLPVSLGWVFLYNYLGTFVSLSIAVFLPAMLGFWLAMLLVFGARMWLALPLILGFFLMVTALTYQLRAWLARLMENKRRAKTIVAVVTMSFVLLVQLPNLLNIAVNRKHGEGSELRLAVAEARSRGGADLAEKQAQLDAYEADRAMLEASIETWIERCAMVVPVGWLGLGMRAMQEERLLPSALTLLGLLGIGILSLRKSFSQACDVAMGRDSARPVVVKQASRQEGSRELFVARELPGLGSVEAGVVLAYLRHMLRKPELKLVFLRVLLLLLVFVIYLPSKAGLAGSGTSRAFMALGAALLSVMVVDQLSMNLFGIDRHGFRAMVLSPVPRSMLLRARNLALAPICLGFGLAATTGLAFFIHLDSAHFVGACMQVVTAFLLQSLLGNAVSIHAPLRLMDDGMRPRDRGPQLFLRSLLLTLLLVATMSPLLVPIAVEWWLGKGAAWSPYMTLHGVLLLAALALYRWRIQHQGRQLQESEVRILEVLA